MGLRMVSDFLEMDGWDTYFLGGNLPSGEIKAAALEYRAHLLGLSVSITANISRVQEVIELCRQDRELDELKIIVGGYPFSVEPDLWRRVGADGYARDAGEALKIARKVVKARERGA